MNLCKAVALRISELLIEKNMTLYKLEKKSGILHGTMMCIIGEKNKNVTLRTIYQLARGFDMTIIEFLDNKIFSSSNIDFE
ncbi:MAG: helix-turn-helix transcriptional regulator [Clostridia bacterium]|nr:helix-turn-helix transcriptional regulator [Clostridia bacterium]